MIVKRAVTGTIHGRVQGVFFRASLQREAQLRQLTGWVRNLTDGDVEFLAQGQADAVNALIEWARTGPPHARVTNLKIHDVDLQDELISFDIRY